MRRMVFVCAFILGIAAEISAQTVTIDELSAPTTPAFILLEVSPTAIERPESGKAFILNLVNKLSSSEGIPRDYALEITPFWMFPNQTLSFDEYQHAKVPQTIAQTLRISVATAPIPGLTKEADPLGTKLAIGFNTKIFNGQPNPTMVASLADLYAKNAMLLTQDRELEALEERLETLDNERRNVTADSRRAELITLVAGAERDVARKKSEIDKTEAAITSASLRIQALDAQRIGFFMTVAAGQVWDFPGDNTENAAAKRWGAWITPAYRKLRCAKACEASFDFIGVARVLKDPDTSSIVDVGGRLVWHPTKQFNASFELLRRKAPDATGASAESAADSNRTVGLLEYRIKEDLILYGTFGQDFQKATGAKPLVTLLGMNFGFGQKASVTR